MKIKCFSILFVFFIGLLIFNSCYKDSNLLYDYFGKEIVTHMKNAKEIKIYKINPIFHDEYKIENFIRTLNSNECENIKKMLLDESSYVFNLDKRCLFLPEYALMFDDNDELLLLLNFSGKQIAFSNHIHKKINIDPINSDILKIINNSF